MKQWIVRFDDGEYSGYIKVRCSRVVQINESLCRADGMDIEVDGKITEIEEI